MLVQLLWWLQVSVRVCVVICVCVCFLFAFCFAFMQKYVTYIGNHNMDACDYMPAFASEAITVGAYDYTLLISYYLYFVCLFLFVIFCVSVCVCMRVCTCVQKMHGKKKHRTRSSFSNYGSCVDVWAPGSNVRTAYYGSNTAEGKASGTSISAPFVAGIHT